MIKANFDHTQDCKGRELIFEAWHILIEYKYSMSRTNKGSKGPGYDYWTKRASSAKTSGDSIGHATKKRTSQRLRRRSKQKIVDDKDYF